MSLERITLRNFQVHRDLTVLLSPTVTTIVGDNHVGKSSVIRALRFLSLNKLNRSADRYITHGKKTLKVEAVFEGQTVSRTAGKVNRYKLGTKVFAAVGRKPIPQQVERLISLTPANFQSQLDSSFWFSDSPGVVSKKLNQIVNLDCIDSTLASVKSKLTKARSEAELCQQRLKEAEAKKEELKWVPRFVRAWQRLAVLKRKAKRARRISVQLRFMVRECHRAIKSYKTLSAAYRDGKNVVGLGEKAVRAEKRRRTLDKLIAEIEKARIEANEEVPDIRTLETIRADADEVAERSRRLAFLVEDAEKAKGEIWQLERKLKLAEARLRKKGRRCPTCGQKIGGSSRSRHSHRTGT